MLKKCLSVFACTLFLCHGAVAATGSMRCEVKSNDLIIMKNGDAKKYLGYSAGFKAGDILILKYQANSDGVSVAMENFSNPNALPKITTKISQSDTKFASIEIEANQLNSKGGIIRSEVNNSIYATSDSLGFSDHFYKGKFERYYKSDWHGLVYGTIGTLEAHIMGIACTHNNDNLGSFISAIKAY